MSENQINSEEVIRPRGLAGERDFQAPTKVCVLQPGVGTDQPKQTWLSTLVTRNVVRGIGETLALKVEVLSLWRNDSEISRLNSLSITSFRHSISPFPASKLVALLNLVWDCHWRGQGPQAFEGTSFLVGLRRGSNSRRAWLKDKENNLEFRNCLWTMPPINDLNLFGIAPAAKYFVWFDDVGNADFGSASSCQEKSVPGVNWSWTGQRSGSFILSNARSNRTMFAQLLYCKWKLIECSLTWDEKKGAALARFGNIAELLIWTRAIQRERSKPLGDPRP